ncbi:hypothetical protein JGU71_29330 [Antrihabitans sp. YC3-6]|uniref:Uncharacterized protein n=1 Tax=Antrihabitans stalagmiti TaxID=2799499 RepID=A0A934U702_9NOCA|nr:hypothetical protein [Antrihabitans stalagmiti]MBJ8342992.1 hypothetical protein [Antrihabitans stalagmiti]
MADVDANFYTGQAFGTHFVDQSGRVACNFNPVMGGCVLTAPAHHASSTMPVCAGSDTAMPYTAVGWRTASELQTQAPTTCRTLDKVFNMPLGPGPDGTFKDAELPVNSRITIRTSFDDPSATIVCGSRASGLRCSNSAGHGFFADSVGLDVY